MKANYKDTMLLLLRLVIVFIFLWHGIPKLMDPSATSTFFSSLGIPGLVGPIIGVIEVAAAILLFFGLWYKWATYAIAVVMVGAMVLVQLPNLATKGVGAGFERDLLILVSVLLLSAIGPGHLSFHKKKR